MQSLKGKTIIITGGSRGIGREIALRCAKDGANIVIAAKSATPHPHLEGTIYTVADEIEQSGGKALPLQIDVRFPEQVEEMAKKTAEHFGGIDALINNAGAIRLTSVESTDIKRFDLMSQINSRAVLVCSKAVLPYLKKSDNPHILSLSPPLDMNPRWFKNHAPYTITKYGMSMLSIGMAEEFRGKGIAVNTLWPKTIIATAAIEFELGGRQAFDRSRTPEIMADAAWEILRSENLELTGRTLIDEKILRERGVTDFEKYRFNPEGGELMPDLFV